jgi:hypothetical protein
MLRGRPRGRTVQYSRYRYPPEAVIARVVAYLRTRT